MNKENKKKGKKQGKNNSLSIPKTVQDSIPYIAIYKNGMIETMPGYFTKSYKLGNANFALAAAEDQYHIFEKYEELLNMFPPETHFQISIFNRKVDGEMVEDNILLKRKRDGLDEYRDEFNEILKNKISEGQNNLVKEKYLSVGCYCDDIETAVGTFIRFDGEIASILRNICDSDATPMSAEERLGLLYDIYNSNAAIPFGSKVDIGGTESKTFTLDILQRYGITSKDLIGPESIEFAKDYCVLGDKYVRIMYVQNYPSFMSTDFLANVTDTPYNMITSISYEALHQDKIMKMLKDKMVNINADIISKQKKASRGNYNVDTIPTSLRDSRDETQRLIDEMNSKNQKMHYATVTFALFADTLEDLNAHTASLVSTAGRFLVAIKKLNYQQEAGLTTTLPLATNKLAVQRMLTTETAALYIPFTTQELMQRGGFYYGLNAISKNIVVYNRTLANNTNGLILGTPGSGKSFGAKKEILQAILNTDDDVYVIDPEREYASMAQMLGGEVIRVAAGSNTHINPFDMDVSYADSSENSGEDPIALKADFIISMLETIVSVRYGLSSIQKSIIDRCVKEVYVPYLEHMRTQKALGNTDTIDLAHSPTMVDFYEALLRQPEPEAKNLALALEIYTTGSLDTFAHKTNVETKKRFVIYDIKDIGTGLKELGLQVCLNDVWNKTIANKKKGKRTWFYIDEFYLLVQNDSSAKFVQQIFKRARKWGGCPTGITQNVEDMLNSKEARTIISNCEFIMMFKQSPLDGADLAEMFRISDAQMAHVTNAGPGQGLLVTDRAIIPFLDKYPTDTKTYRAMSTKFTDTL